MDRQSAEKSQGLWNHPVSSVTDGHLVPKRPTAQRRAKPHAPLRLYQCACTASAPLQQLTRTASDGRYSRGEWGEGWTETLCFLPGFSGKPKTATKSTGFKSMIL